MSRLIFAEWMLPLASLRMMISAIGLLTDQVYFDRVRDTVAITFKSTGIRAPTARLG